MKKAILLLLTLALVMTASAQKGYLKAYTIYDAKGHEVGFEEMMEKVKKSDVVFFGEMHNSPVSHWLETQVLKSMYHAFGRRLTVGMEMFESDNQLIIDEYLDGWITTSRFEAECRLWPNYSTDYEPIVDMVKQDSLRLIATNVPRRYANMVKNRGLKSLDSLTSQAKSYMCPLPLQFKADEGQASAFSMMALMGKGGNPGNMAAAQALKDATMGWNIARNIKGKFLHINGNYHSDNRQGTVEYLLRYRPNTSVSVITSATQDDISRLDEENKGRGDFIICVTSDFNTSY